ncbi:CBS domain-containing protein [Natronospira proteinivora]|uniref:CBS domain-containing protein n=1 Tax=Natronospira proteinivora TaxID=1807133 RepID=A0ABT1GEP8_9GAMM|nr:DUF294 nucleotidyltransferase-like domain-containing protein [Natronospira proteinivora]MCP1728422.1 CBS domain-containing protein [Natronospira proteinivora]
MSADLKDLRAFLAELHPFDGLPEAVREGVIPHLESLYICEDNRDALIRQKPAALYLVRSATLDRLDHRGEAIERLEGGDLFGDDCLEPEFEGGPRVSVIQDGIVYRLSADHFQRLVQSHPDFASYFRDKEQGGLIRLGRYSNQQTDWAERAIKDILARPPISAHGEESIRTAAERMASAGVSSLPVLDDERLEGILTDRDLRNRVVATGLSPSQPIHTVMSRDPSTIGHRQSVFDALNLMSRDNIHHLPVLDEQGRLVGLVTSSDLMRQQQSEPVLLINRLHKAADRASLVHEAGDIPAHVRNFARRTEDADKTSQLLASLTDTMTRRLIELWIDKAGPAPADYAWVAFGSQAREDQNLHSDQDNGLIIADGAPDDAAPWFAGLADTVCSGLAECGIRLCPGEVMARNPEWRLGLSEWTARFRSWTNEPTPKGVMQSMIFFDSRMIAGEKMIYQEHREAVARLGRNQIFLAHMAQRIGELPIPLGLFDRLRTRSHQGLHGIDIKRNGIAVLNDIVRIHSLQAGLTEPRTPLRLDTLGEQGEINRSDAQDLREAWHLLINLRLQAQIDEKTVPGEPNTLVPARLNTLERRQLKAAFRIIKSAQQTLAFKFRSGY